MSRPTAAYLAARRKQIDARAQRTLPIGLPATDLRARTSTEIKPVAGPIRNRKAPRMTAVQRDSRGRMSDWNRSPYAPRGGWR